MALTFPIASSPLTVRASVVCDGIVVDCHFGIALRRGRTAADDVFGPVDRWDREVAERHLACPWPRTLLD